jgi:hypothetical protein
MLDFSASPMFLDNGTNFVLASGNGREFIELSPGLPRDNPSQSRLANAGRSPENH